MATRTKSKPRGEGLSKRKPPFPDPNAMPADEGAGDNGEGGGLPADAAPAASPARARAPNRVDGTAGRGLAFGEPGEAQRELPFEAAEGACNEGPAAETGIPLETPAALPSASIRAIPLGKLPPVGYVPRHVDCQLRTPAQRENLKRMLVGLDQTGGRLSNGHRVTTYADVVRWLLENVEKDDAHQTAQAQP